ncbi:MAG TPA: Fic/DOC family N-terminal domain-containing protein [Melioribacteraceae bacterium]|nr:Fic/DOC family N-terminal domain-containing protein [Melioribacteraceae bacterium]
MINRLPPEPKLKLDSEIYSLLNSAEQSLSKFEGVFGHLGEKHQITNLLMLNEAVQSCRIGGYQYTLEEFFINKCVDHPSGLSEIKNYLSACNLGIRLLKDVASTDHILKSIYKELSNNQQDDLYLYRTTKLSPVSGDFTEAESPSDQIPELMRSLEKYISSDVSYPLLINVGLVHGYFETIKPFSVNNTPSGRILIDLHLFWKRKFKSFPLQISKIINDHKKKYYSSIGGIVQNGEWIDWLKLFLNIIIESSLLSLSLARNIGEVETTGMRKIIESDVVSSPVIKLYNYIFIQPVISIPQITSVLNLTKQTANIAVSRMLELQILEEITGKQRYRIFSNKALFNLLNN